MSNGLGTPWPLQSSCNRTYKCIIHIWKLSVRRMALGPSMAPSMGPRPCFHILPSRSILIHISWRGHRSNQSCYIVRTWTIKFMRNFNPSWVHKRNTHFNIDFAITRNLSYLHAIHTINDLTSDHLPNVRRFEVANSQLDIPIPSRAK